MPTTNDDARKAAPLTAELPPSLIRRLEPIRDLLHGKSTNAVVPFCGSGLSVSGRLPTWTELLKALIEYLPASAKPVALKRLKQGEHIRVAGYLADHPSVGRPRILSTIVRLFQRPAASRPSVFDAIAALPTAHFVSTSYDPWLKDAVTQRFAFAVPVVLPGDGGSLGHRDTSHPWVFLIHGDADKPETCVLSAQDYRHVLHGDLRWRGAVDTLLRSRHFLFMGTSMSEPHLRVLFEEFEEVFHAEGGLRRHWWLGQVSDEIEAHDLAQLGIEVIDYGDHKNLIPILEWLAKPLNDPDDDDKMRSPIVVRNRAPLHSLREWMLGLARQLPALSREIGDGRDMLDLFVHPDLADLHAHHGRLRGPSRLSEVLECDCPKWLIEGEPGSGKSTLLRVQVAGSTRPEGVPTLYLPLSDIVASGGLEATVEAIAPGVWGWVSEAIESGQVLVLLDGFDEVDADPAYRAATAIAGILAQHKDNRLVVAGRSGAFAHPAARFSREWGRLTLRPLERDDAVDLVDHHIADRSLAEAIVDRLRAHRHDVSGNPLLLTLAAHIVKSAPRPWTEESVPPGRTALFDRALRVLVLGDTREEGRGMRFSVDAEAAIRWLSVVALELHGVDGAPLRLPAVAGALSLAGCPDPGGFLIEAKAVTSLVDHRRPAGALHEHVTFSHRTFREFLAGMALYRRVRAAGGDPDQTAVMDILDRAVEEPGRWSQVVVHATALLSGAAPDLPAVSGAADSLVQACKARRRTDRPCVAVLALADAEGVSQQVLLEVLEISADRKAWQDRVQVFERLPKLLGDAGALARFCARVRKELRPTHGCDLFWLMWWLDHIASGDAEALGLESVSDSAQEVARRERAALFSHLPEARRREALSILSREWLQVRPGEHLVGSTQQEQAEASVAYHGNWTPSRVDSDENRRLLYNLPEQPRARVELEGPRHPVTIDYDLWAMAIPVTGSLYRLFDPLHEGSVDGDSPVVGVTWWEAMSFASWLGVRLPTEAEWECMARAGRLSTYCLGDTWHELERVGWYSKNKRRDAPHPVRGLLPNAWGFHDVHGNVWEWCIDVYPRKYDATVSIANAGLDDLIEFGVSDTSLRVVRGGAWNSGSRECRSAKRHGLPPATRNTVVGFRLFCEGKLPF